MSDPANTGPIGPGTDIAGFVIEAIAGRGGMGVVYRARQLEPDRIVALKIIDPQHQGDETFRRRFQREAKIAARIEHPNVIPVYAVGEQDGMTYIAMRYVKGTDLRSLIAEQGRLDPRRAAVIVDQIAQALDAAHEQGLVHRDVKPANVLIATAGGREHAYLTDFGITRLAGQTQGMTLTGTGALVGTIDYVAPEQARGDRVDARTDVYSLGCLLFHALTGEVPYPKENALGTIFAHATQPPPSLSERVAGLPPALDPVLARAMAKDPDHRYLSAGDLGRAAMAAVVGQQLSRAEHSVATGDAAPDAISAVHPGGQRTVPRSIVPGAEAEHPLEQPETEQPSEQPETQRPSEQPATQQPAEHYEAPQPQPGPAPSAGRQGPLTGKLALGLFTAVIAIVVVVIIVASGGKNSSTTASTTVNDATTGTPSTGTSTSTSTGSTTSDTPTKGIVLGKSIGSVTLGQDSNQMKAEVTSEGYAAHRESAHETSFTSKTKGVLVVDYDQGQVTLIQKFNDASINVNGVSVDSTQRQALKALPTWHSIRCAKRITLYISPDGHTMFELPHGLDTTNSAGFNGVVVSASPVDASFC